METHKNMGMVLDMDRFSLHDGPGIRMTLFLKGCPLRCAWCHSPESQSGKPELLYQKARCQACFRCAAACPEGAIAPSPNRESIKIDREKCVSCFRCTHSCPQRSLRIGGKLMSPGQIIEIARRDRDYYTYSGGGVTVSGGEPLAQSAFALEVMNGVKALHIHTALETSGMGDTANLLEIAQATNLLLFDIKLLDPELHKHYTGVSNARILMNLRALSEDEALRRRVFIRTPLIPGINDSAQQISAIARYVKTLGISHMDVLPYNQMAEAKYEWIGADYPLAEIEPREKGYDEKLRALVRCEGLTTEFEREG